ncbi:MAG TPA: molybdenum cofactor guanylyltransferase [Dehalococcoidia bacterium]
MSEMTTMVILTGGRGSRIGGDKAAQLLAGRPLLQWVVSAADGIASEIIIARSPGQALPHVLTDASVRVCDDHTAGLGPLSGIVAGLAITRDPHAIVVPCDAPLLRPALILAMVAAIGDAEVLVPEVDGRLQTAFGVWSTTCVGVVREAVRSDDRSVHGVLRRLRTGVLSEDDVRACDPGLLSFLNVNTPDDLAGLEARIASMRRGTGAAE